jgi:hypothetical protein
MKTNKELNQEFDQKQKDRVRPKDSEYQWEPLAAVIRQWVLTNEQT